MILVQASLLYLLVILVQASLLYLLVILVQASLLYLLVILVQASLLYLLVILVLASLLYLLVILVLLYLLGKPVVPAGDSSAGKPVVPAGDSSAGKPVVPAGDSSAGKPVVAAGDSKESIDVKADAICTGPQSLAQNLVQATNGMKEHSLDLCAEDENMVVLLEQPYHHQRRRSSVEVRGYNDSRCLEPRGKRLRLSCPGSREVPMCPAPYSQIPSSVASVSDASSWVQSSGISQPPVDSQLCPSLLSNIRTTKAIVFIDLTKDESESDESVLCRGAQYEDDPDNVIVLSGSSSTSAQLASVHGKEEDNLSDDGLPSPECLGYLPPSPGREGVSSILKRKALGF